MGCLKCNLPNMASDSGLEESLAPRTFAFEIEATDDAKAICDLKDVSFTFNASHSRDIDLRVSGVRSKSISIWKTSTQSGFHTMQMGLVDVLEVCLVTRGHMYCMIESDEFQCGENTGMLVAHPAAQALSVSGGTEMIVCAFERKALTAASAAYALADGDDPACFTPVVEINTLALRALLQILQLALVWLDFAGQPSAVVYSNIEELFFMQFLSVWPRRRRTKLNAEAGPPKILRLATDFIDVHLGQQITVSDVAKACGVGVRTLQKAFSENLHVSPLQYITNTRLDRVHKDLTDGPGIELVSQVAYRWGFVHMGDFSRRYKARFGVTPSTTRR
jgi:AraC-like DNA-binding protein